MKTQFKQSKVNCSRPTSKLQQGVVLLEAMIALLIFSMGVLAIAGLQGVMLKNTSDTKYRSDASYIAQKRLASLWVSPPTANVNEVDLTTGDAALLPGGKISTSYRTADGITTIIVKWTLPGETEHNYQVNARIAGV